MTTYKSDRVRSALRAVLNPLADLMIKSGITFSSATELLKQVLYDAAQGGQERPMSDSQISLLTGLHRKDVRRFREAGEKRARPSFASAAARVIDAWSQDPAFQHQGAPAPLPRASEEGVSFDGLVQSLRLDLAPGTILLHLTDLDLVRFGKDGSLVLVSDAYLPLAGSEEMLVAFEKNIAAHLGASVENITQDFSPNFERASHFNRLSPASAEALEKLARSLAADQLAAFNAEARRLQTQDKDALDANQRISFGTYVLARDPSKKGNQDT